MTLTVGILGILTLGLFVAFVASAIRLLLGYGDDCYSTGALGVYTAFLGTVTFGFFTYVAWVNQGGR